MKVVSLLMGRGYQVMPANNGERAIKKLDEKDLDLVAVNLKMSGMEGMGTLKKLSLTIDTVTLTGDALLTPRRRSSSRGL
jgi:CheY-like chemotaxis protein